MGLQRGNPVYNPAHVSAKTGIPMDIVKRYALPAFFLLAYLLSWYPWLLHLAHVTRGEGGLNPLGPFVAALILSGITGRWISIKRLLKRLVEWRVGVRWYAFVLLLPAAICVLVVSLNLLLGAPHPTAAQLAKWPEMPSRFLFIFLFIGLGEEPGWRGFALPRLQQKYSELGASLILAVFWAAWHLPLTATELKIQYVPQFLIGILSATVVHTWVFNRTKGSVLLQMIFHSAVNTVGAGYFFQMFSGADLVRLWWLFSAAWCLTAILAAAQMHRTTVDRVVEPHPA